MRLTSGIRRRQFARLTWSFAATVAVLAGLVVDPTVALAEVSLVAESVRSKLGPQVVTILSPLDGGDISSGELAVKIVVRVPEGSSLLGFRALIDGRLATRTRGVTLTAAPAPDKTLQATHTLTVPLFPRDCVLSILADTAPTKSPPASVRLRWRGAPSTNADHLRDFPVGD